MIPAPACHKCRASVRLLWTGLCRSSCNGLASGNRERSCSNPALGPGAWRVFRKGITTAGARVWEVVRIGDGSSRVANQCHGQHTAATTSWNSHRRRGLHGTTITCPVFASSAKLSDHRHAERVAIRATLRCRDLFATASCVRVSVRQWNGMNEEHCAGYYQREDPQHYAPSDRFTPEESPHLDSTFLARRVRSNTCTQPMLFTDATSCAHKLPSALSATVN